jgi:hypothetical protein
MSIPGLLLSFAVIIAGTFATVRMVARWVYRDPHDPDQRKFRGDWVLWRGELNRKEEGAE